MGGPKAALDEESIPGRAVVNLPRVANAAAATGEEADNGVDGAAEGLSEGVDVSDIRERGELLGSLGLVAEDADAAALAGHNDRVEAMATEFTDDEFADVVDGAGDANIDVLGGFGSEGLDEFYCRRRGIGCVDGETECVLFEEIPRRKMTEMEVKEEKLKRKERWEGRERGQRIG